ncbi:hypothetical protein UCDDS831_g02738 [Diplodia seriata]|uniref:PA14 domain-containing protein n=1 Tax=Diplodia seriata TaxID=420778 RepID=A0A0G2EMU2_9PEZI|nr:hypothetical protein UCDDS831_g02738 [Diplodia seriata]
MRYSPLLLLPLAVSAAPQVKRGNANAAINSLFCALNKDVITLLKAQTTATSYCSSYLSIATQTLYFYHYYSHSFERPRNDNRYRDRRSIHYHLNGYGDYATLVPGTVTDAATQTLTPTSTSAVTVTETSTNTITDFTTTTTTTTTTVYATATSITASGLTYRKYTHSYNANLAASGFTPSYFKTASVDFSGSLQNLDFSTPNWPSGNSYLTIDGHYFASDQAAILMQGFFVAQATGTYTISTSPDYIDNYGYLWTGDAAYTWTDGTTAYAATRTGGGYFGGSTSITMNAGDAVPMTWLWANGGGVGRSHFVITTPSGSSVTDTTGYFAPACDSSIFT